MGKTNPTYLLLALLLGTSAYVGRAATFTTLATMNYPSGSKPHGDLLLDGQGNLYGTTRAGGARNLGTVYKVTPDGALSLLATFDGTNTGGDPQGSLIADQQGNLYGTTNGTIFKVSPSGGFLAQWLIPPGAGYVGSGRPYFDAAGNLYATTTASGGVGSGSIIKMTHGGPISMVVGFSYYGAIGAYPVGLTADSAGNLYGTTSYGGSGANGTIFRLTPSETLEIISDFGLSGTGGYKPMAGVSVDSNGNIYGTTNEGGSAFQGVVYMCTPSGQLTTLATFSGPNGSKPYGGVIRDAVGNLFGTTEFGGAFGLGTVFRLSPSGELTTLHSFDNSLAFRPRGTLIADVAGNLYGTLEFSNVVGGTVFKISDAGYIVPEPSMLVGVLVATTFFHLLRRRT